MKECRSCGQTKEYNQFSKCEARKDGLQDKCKECNKKDNYKFRTEINPEHHSIWQRNNSDKVLKITKKFYHKKIVADNSRSKIYTITAPDGMIYVGLCQTAMSVRRAAHKKEFKSNNGSLPLLHKSINKWGWDKHIWKVIDLSGVDREMLKIIETNMIRLNKMEGISLNIREI